MLHLTRLENPSLRIYQWYSFPIKYEPRFHFFPGQEAMRFTQSPHVIEGGHPHPGIGIVKLHGGPSPPVNPLVVPGQRFGVRPVHYLLGNDDLLTVHCIVIPAVLELLVDFSADFEM